MRKKDERQRGGIHLKKKTLLGTDLNVSAVCLGTGKYGDVVSEREALDLLWRYAENGGNFIDTANVYGKWCEIPDNYSEKILGKFLREYPNKNQLIISTKGGHPPIHNKTESRLSEQEVRKDLEESLRTLGKETIDIYWLHRDDPTIPVERLIEMLETFKREGKIRYYGCSNWTEDRIRAAQSYAKKEQVRGFIAVQNRWSLARVEQKNLADSTLQVVDQRFYHFLKESDQNLTQVSFSAMGHGVFTKWKQNCVLPLKIEREYQSGINKKRLQAVTELAQTLDCSIASLVLAWQINKSVVHAIPIAMPTKRDQLEDLFHAGEMSLTAQQVEKLDCGEEW